MTDRIIAVYIEKYRHLTSALIGFGTEYHCTINDLKSVIEISKLDIIPEAYFADGINGLGVIVGKNGSGKSTLLELISVILNSQGKTDLFEYEILGCIIWIDSSNNINVTGPVISMHEAKNRKEQKIPIIKYSGIDIIPQKRFPSLNVVLASSMGAMTNRKNMPLYNYPGNTTMGCDVRSDEIIRKDFESECNSDDRHTSASPIEQFSIIHRFHATKEKFRQINFLNHIRNNLKDDSIFKDALQANLIGLSPRTLIPSMLNSRGVLPEEIQETLSESDPHTQEGKLARAMCWSLIFEATYTLDGKERKEKIKELWSNNEKKLTKGTASEATFYQGHLGYLFDHLYHNSFTKVKEKAKLWGLLTGRPVSMPVSYMANPTNGIGSLPKKNSISIDDNPYYWYKNPAIQPSSNIENGIFETLTTYMIAGKIAPFLDIEYGFYKSDKITVFSLSHGEDAMLSLFGRILQAMSDISELNPNKNTLVILDEADIALHPEWQRKFISSLCFALPKIASKNGTQVLISTHTPIVLSDIPHENHTRLMVSNTFPKTATTQTAASPTIAANLYDLLHDEFYLEGGFIGQHATEILELLRKDDSRISKIKSEIISKIADPILRKAFTALERSKNIKEQP